MDREVASACHAFLVRAARETRGALRVLDLFAQRDLIPDEVTIENSGGETRMLVKQSGLSEPDADTLARKIQALVMTQSVELQTTR